MKKILSCIFVSILFYPGCKHEHKNAIVIQNPIKKTPETTGPKEELVYGLPSDKFNLDKKRVKRDQTLAGILHESGLPGNKVHHLINLSEKIFDSRKIKRGNTYAFLTPKADSVDNKYMVYEIDKLNFLRFSAGDSLDVVKISKETDTITRYVAFSINNSLWGSIIEHGLDPLLAIELSEIYAWTIDFFGLQLGDSARVVYDELYVEGKAVGIHKIHAASFKHINRDYYAIAFHQNGKEGYYDLEGNSLKKAFLKAPLRYSRISSKFSNSRLHPILKIRRPHHGVDYAAPIGTPVQSIGDGVVIGVTHTKGAGRMVKIKHNSVYTTAYLHLHGYGKGIKKGEFVTQGQVIGYVGSSGLSTGPHLDFRIYKNGGAIDPLKIESPPVEPVKQELIPSYHEMVYVSLQNLNIIQEGLIYSGINEDLMATY